MRCKIHSPSLAQTPAYEALPYIWGKMDRYLVASVVSGDCEKEILFVTRQLLMVLRRLRLLFALKLWIDQICMSQKNDTEKGTRTQLMGFIHRNAGLVVIWLKESCRWTVKIGFADLLADLCKVITESLNQKSANSLELIQPLVDIRSC